MSTIRPYEPGDRDAVAILADRLMVGAPAWRDPDLWLTAVRGWVDDSISACEDDGHGLLVAVEEDRVAGFVSVGVRQHFTGTVDAYIGELVVAAGAEGRGVGQDLLRAAERWAISNGHERLTLETGAANPRARDFYRLAGYHTEDVRFTKLLS